MLRRDSLLKAGVMAGIGLVEGGPKDGDRAPTFEHGGLVSRLVDSCREARKDHKTAAHELRGHRGGQRSALVGSAARAHDRDARAVEEARVPGEVHGAPAGEGHSGTDGPLLNRTVGQGD
jgi:hypothetical protein